MVEIREINAKRIMTKTRIPEADYVINHYSGCTHGCVYCYARFMCRWRKGKEKWGEFVDVKVNAAELIEKESENKIGIVLMSSVSDPYQPIERKYKLTRKVLENLNKNMKLSILTKSDLITRDIDLFKKFKKHELGITITNLDNSIAKIFEPDAPSPLKRINALKQLKKSGLSTYVFIGPILPFIADIEEVVRECTPYVDKILFEDLNLGAAKASIMKTIRENYPELKEKYLDISEDFWTEKQKEVENLGKKYKIPIKIFFKNTGTLDFKSKK